jgi:hypothetical protein
MDSAERFSSKTVVIFIAYFSLFVGFFVSRYLRFFPSCASSSYLHFFLGSFLIAACSHPRSFQGVLAKSRSGDLPLLYRIQEVLGSDIASEIDYALSLRTIAIAGLSNRKCPAIVLHFIRNLIYTTQSHPHFQRYVICAVEAWLDEP